MVPIYIVSSLIAVVLCSHRADYCKALHFDPCCLPARVNLAYTLQVSSMTSFSHTKTTDVMLFAMTDGGEIPTIMESLHLCFSD